MKSAVVHTHLCSGRSPRRNVLPWRGNCSHIFPGPRSQESRQARRIHPPKINNKWGSRWHTLPLLVVVRPIRFTLPQHECRNFLGCVTLYLAETHDTNVHTARTHNSGGFGVYGSRVTTLRMRACHCTMPGTVSMQEMFWEVTAASGTGRATGHIGIDWNCPAFTKRPEQS